MTVRELRALLFTIENQDAKISDLRLSKAGHTLHATVGRKAVSLYVTEEVPA